VIAPESLLRLARRDAALLNRHRDHPATVLADEAWVAERYAELLAEHGYEEAPRGPT
jgi:hypothetical protein